MGLEKQVSDYYSIWMSGAQILEAVKKNAANPSCLNINDLSAYDELHIGGRAATAHFASCLGLRNGMSVLDIGSGLGGPARFMAHNYGVSVRGLDLCPAFCCTARFLSEAVGLSGQTSFYAGSALAMPFADGSFDVVMMQHVGMNIESKKTVYQEIARLLKPKGVLGIYDVMASEDFVHLPYPMPWALTDETSFIRTPAAVQQILESIGFKVVRQENRREFALKSLQRLLEKPLQEEKRRRSLDNLFNAVKDGLCAPEIIVCELI